MPLGNIYNYFRSYDKTSYAVFAQQGAEPNETDIAGFESRIGFRLPDEFREFAVHPLGGLYMEVKAELWPRLQPGQVGPFWTFLYGMMVYSLSKKAPDWLQMSHGWTRMVQDGYPRLVPFLKIRGDADPYCFTPDQRIVIWRHETPTESESVSESFSEVVMREIRALEERKARKLKGEDKQPLKRPNLP
jgi:hypothetical protein